MKNVSCQLRSDLERHSQKGFLIFLSLPLVSRRLHPEHSNRALEEGQRDRRSECEDGVGKVLKAVWMGEIKLGGELE